MVPQPPAPVLASASIMGPVVAVGCAGAIASSIWVNKQKKIERQGEEMDRLKTLAKEAYKKHYSEIEEILGDKEAVALFRKLVEEKNNISRKKDKSSLTKIVSDSDVRINIPSLEASDDQRFFVPVKRAQETLPNFANRQRKMTS